MVGLAYKPIRPVRELQLLPLKHHHLAHSSGADSIRYISVEGLEASVGEGAKDSDGGYCTACLTGKYPLELQW